MGAEAPPAYRFDRFVLDLERGLLLADGAECPLRPDVIVTDDSIVQCVGEIRRALGNEAPSGPLM